MRNVPVIMTGKTVSANIIINYLDLKLRNIIDAFFVQQYKTLEPYTILCIVNKKEINLKSKGQPEDPHVKNVKPVFVLNAGPGQ